MRKGRILIFLCVEDCEDLGSGLPLVEQGQDIRHGIHCGVGFALAIGVSHAEDTQAANFGVDVRGSERVCGSHGLFPCFLNCDSIPYPGLFVKAFLENMRYTDLPKNTSLFPYARNPGYG